MAAIQTEGLRKEFPDAVVAVEGLYYMALLSAAGFGAVTISLALLALRARVR